jgi:hypothetical protein
VLLVVLLVLTAGLAMTNPDRDDFARFYADRASAEVARELGLQGPIGDAIGGAAQGLLETALRDRVHRRDWLVASVYTVPAAGTDPVWLGVAGIFLPIDRGG